MTENTQIPFNPFLLGTDGPQFILDPDKCQAGSAKRVTRDNTAQRGGEILHKHFKTGFVMQIGGIYANVLNPDGCEMEPLCGSDLVELDDLLMLNLDAMENVDGSIAWTPTGFTDRAVFGARWLGPDGIGGAAFTAVLVERDDQIWSGFQVALVSPFPYAVDAAVTETSLEDGTPVTVTNNGTTEYWPVVEVYGPTSAFTITNNTTGLTLSYNAGFPGAGPILSGHLIEFDYFRNTAYFDYDQNPAMAGIDVAQSDFWSLVPGDNEIEIAGADGLLKWQSAYV